MLRLQLLMTLFRRRCRPMFKVKIVIVVLSYIGLRINGAIGYCIGFRVKVGDSNSVGNKLPPRTSVLRSILFTSTTVRCITGLIPLGTTYRSFFMGGRKGRSEWFFWKLIMEKTSGTNLWKVWYGHANLSLSESNC